MALILYQAIPVQRIWNEGIQMDKLQYLYFDFAFFLKKAIQTSFSGELQMLHYFDLSYLENE